MSARHGYRRPLEAFRTTDAPSLVIRKVTKSALALTEVRGIANHGVTASIPYDDAFLVQLRLLECEQCDYFSEGQHVDSVDHRAGLIQLHDLRRDPTVDLRDPFHVMHFYLPRAALNAVADEIGGGTIDALELEPGHCADDAAARHLLLSLRPALERPAEANALFVDHVAAALCSHVAQTYGGIQRLGNLPRGGLARWQEKRAKELLESDLSGEFPLSRLALECGLSVRHFTRAFRQSVGMPPHRYLLKRRIERARDLLRDPSLFAARSRTRVRFFGSESLHPSLPRVDGYESGCMASPTHIRAAIRLSAIACDRDRTTVVHPRDASAVPIA